MEFWTNVGMVAVNVVLLLAILMVLDRVHRSEEREEGFLPIPTSRGDRFFLGFMAVVGFGMLWIAFVYPTLGMKWALVIGAGITFFMVRYG